MKEDLLPGNRKFLISSHKAKRPKVFINLTNRDMQKQAENQRVVL